MLNREELGKDCKITAHEYSCCLLYLCKAVSLLQCFFPVQQLAVIFCHFLSSSFRCSHEALGKSFFLCIFWCLVFVSAACCGQATNCFQNLPVGSLLVACLPYWVLHSPFQQQLPAEHIHGFKKEQVPFLSKVELTQRVNASKTSVNSISAVLVELVIPELYL